MDYQLSDPVALLIIGVLVSLVWEQTNRFQEDKVSPLAKIAAVLVTGVALAIGFTLLKTGLPTGRADWYALVINAITVAISTQAFHLSVKKYLPGLSDLLVQLRIGSGAKTAVETTVKTTTGAAAISGEITTLTPLAPVAPKAPEVEVFGA